MSDVGLLANIIISGIISVIGTIGNGVVILPFIVSPSLRTVNYLFVIQLAIVDITKAAVVLSTKVVNQAKQSSSMNPKICPTFGMLRTVGSCQSALLLGMIALVRYCKVVHPDRFCVIFSMKWALCYSTGLVFGTIVLSLLPILGIGCYKYSFWHGACFVDWSQRNIIFRSLYYIFNVGIPFPVLIFCYYKIFKALRNHARIISNIIAVPKVNIRSASLDPSPLNCNANDESTINADSPRTDPRAVNSPKTGHIRRLDVAELNRPCDSRGSDTSTGKRRKADFEIVITKVMFAIVVVYVVCWLPALLVNILSLSKAVDVPDDVILFAVTLVDLKVALNPVIYIFSSKRFRVHIIRTFKNL